MPSAGVRLSLPSLLPRLALLASLACAGVSRHLSPWEMASRTELLLEEAAADGLLTPADVPLDGAEPTQKQFEASCELVGE